MSLLTVSAGSARNSFQVQRFGSSTSPSMVNVPGPSDPRGVGPAERTGKSLTTYCPGGTRELETLSRRLPLKPREMNPIDFSLSAWYARRPPSRRAFFCRRSVGDDAERSRARRKGERRLGELGQAAARHRKAAHGGGRGVDDVQPPAGRVKPRVEGPDAYAALERCVAHVAQRAVREDPVARDRGARRVDGEEVTAIT